MRIGLRLFCVGISLSLWTAGAAGFEEDLKAGGGSLKRGVEICRLPNETTVLISHKRQELVVVPSKNPKVTTVFTTGVVLVETREGRTYHYPDGSSKTFPSDHPSETSLKGSSKAPRKGFFKSSKKRGFFRGKRKKSRSGISIN